MKYVAMVLAMLPVVGFAHEFTVGELKIGHPWTRATPAGSDMAAGYLTVTNTGKVADVLESAAVVGVDEVMIHTTVEEKGVARMDAMEDGVVIAPGQTVKLVPGGTHLMWMGMSKPLVAGEMVSGTLRFKSAGKVEVGFKVEALGAKEPAHQHKK